MESSEGQLALITVWASGTAFKVDTGKSPKANFAGLAKTLGWVGGDANWQLHWEACFQEPYPFGRREASTVLITPIATPELEERSRRRLSSSSRNSSATIGSDFSLVSVAPSVQSLDTNGSIVEGIVLGLESVTITSTENLLRSASTAASQCSEPSARSDISTKATGSVVHSAADGPQELLKASAFWYKYPGFVPDPRAPFKHELRRLFKHLGTKTGDEKKAIQTKALAAEISHHYGASMSRLDRWQELCDEVGIKKIPTSITQCQRVLKPVFVNLFNLVDHRRNPDLQVIRFKSYEEFSRFTKKGNQFPRDCAKQEGFIKILLKKV